jgi:hypothetical protein
LLCQWRVAVFVFGVDGGTCIKKATRGVQRVFLRGEMQRHLADYPSACSGATLDVHVLGAFHILKHTVPRISDGGSIIITSSVVGAPEDIAHGMLYLAADESAMVTSHTFSIDVICAQAVEAGRPAGPPHGRAVSSARR